MKVATNIETELWNRIVQQLVNDDWTPTFKYDNFDAGIDSDFIILEKGQEEILFGWDNWFEGEIKCSERRMQELEKQFDVGFTYGEAINLNSEVIELYREWKSENKMNNPGLIRKNK